MRDAEYSVLDGISQWLIGCAFVQFNAVHQDTIAEEVNLRGEELVCLATKLIIPKACKMTVMS